ncbi:MAG: hypothetical protein OHK0029_40870 [Armatimonadaceae bacterium]
MTARKWEVLTGIGVAVCAVAIAAGGCNRQSQTAEAPASEENQKVAGTATVSSKPASEPTPKPENTDKETKTPLDVRGTVEGLDFTLFDASGKKIAEVAAKEAGLSPAKEGAFATVSRGTATLYRNGAPAATLTADRVSADEQAQTVQAQGNVLVEALQGEGTPTLRADKVVWQYKADTITGSGNVLATMKPEWRIPARSFQADTRLQRVQIEGNGQPATGKF